jgi:hypothetical protein
VGTGGRQRLRYHGHPRHRGGLRLISRACRPTAGRLSPPIDPKKCGAFCHWSVTSSSSTEINQVWGVDPSRRSQKCGPFLFGGRVIIDGARKIEAARKDGWERGERSRLESRRELSGQVVKLDQGFLGDGLRPGVSTDTWLCRLRQHGGSVHDQAGRFEEIPRISYPRDRRERAWAS